MCKVFLLSCQLNNFILICDDCSLVDCTVTVYILFVVILEHCWAVAKSWKNVLRVLENSWNC